MNSYSSSYFWAFICMLASFSSCMDAGEPYPSGSGLLTCKIQGEKFVPKKDFDIKGSNDRSASIVNDTLGLVGIYSVGDRHESIGIRVENFSGTGTYPLVSREENYGRYSLSAIHAYTDLQHTGEIIVTHYLPEQGIIAGTFQYTTHHPATGNTYEITEGRFDMRCTIR